MLGSDIQADLLCWKDWNSIVLFSPENCKYIYIYPHLLFDKIQQTSV